jgi:DNA-directed RNA polymerase subunit RPC12/RpoP
LAENWDEKALNQKIINCPHCGKVISTDVLRGKKQPEVKCPRCSSQRAFKDGLRNMREGSIQRYLCLTEATGFRKKSFEDIFKIKICHKDTSAGTARVINKKMRLLSLEQLCQQLYSFQNSI